MGEFDGLLGRVVLDRPRGRTGTHLGGGSRLVLVELVPEHVAEQAVEPEGVAMRIERDHEQVLPFQLAQAGQRPGRPERGVAERAAHDVEHGGTAQPPLRAGIQWLEQLGPHVLRDGRLGTAEVDGVRPCGRDATDRSAR